MNTAMSRSDPERLGLIRLNSRLSVKLTPNRKGYHLH